MWEAQNYINGEFVESSSESTFENLDPCTEESLGTFFNSTNEEKNIMAEEFIGLDKKQAKDLMDYVYDKKFNFLYINNFMEKHLKYYKNFNQLVLKNI